jgi:hypothetical protein
MCQRVSYKLNRRQFSRNYDWIYDIEWMGKEPPIQWSDYEIHLLSEQVLTVTLAEIGDNRKSQKSKAEAFAWVQSEDRHQFSFINCCRLAGLDYEKIRESVSFIYRKTLM